MGYVGKKSKGGRFLMPSRIRYLKPDFFKDEDLAALSFETRLCFAGLWCVSDKAGRLEDRPQRLKVEIFPYDNIDIERCLKDLSKTKSGSGQPFINRYNVDGQRYIQIISWDKHQKPHHTEKESKIPAPKEMGMGMGMGMENQLKASTALSNGEITVKPPLNKELDTTKPTPQEIFAFWNETCPIKIRALNKSRINKIKVRLLESEFFNNWKVIFCKIPKSSFLCGDSDQGWKADFDWIIANDTNYMKVLEGKYDGNGNNRKTISAGGRKHQGQPPTDRNAGEIPYARAGESLKIDP